MSEYWLNIIQCIIITFIGAFTFRVRGGLRIPGTDKKFPLNKWWFGIGLAVCTCWLTGNWLLQYIIIIIIAGYYSAAQAGWGEAVGIILRWAGPLNPDRQDMPQVDEFLENFEIKERNIKIGKYLVLHIPHYKLIDHARTFAVCFLIARGFFISFIIGLGIQSISFMPVGITMPIWYYLAGLYSRKIKQLTKNGWNCAEVLFGAVIGFWLYICLKVICF